MTITRAQERKLLRLIGEYGGACGSNAVIQLDADGDDNAGMRAMANRAERKEDACIRRLQAYIHSLTT